MEHRREKRFASYAKVVLVETNNLGYLRDLNSLGCQIDFLEPPPIKPEDTVEVRIIPNEELNLPNIDLFLSIRWMRQEDPFFSIGGAFAQIPEVHRDAYEGLLSYFRT